MQGFLEFLGSLVVACIVFVITAAVVGTWLKIAIFFAF